MIKPRRSDPDSPTDRFTRSGVAPSAVGLVIFHRDEVKAHPLPVPSKVQVGRSQRADVVIDDSSISRVHVTIEVRATDETPTIVVTDLGSSNGTRVSGVVLEANQPRTVQFGQAVELGSHVYLVLTREAAAANVSRAAPTRSLVVQDEVMRRLHEFVKQVAPTDLSVLLLGETGVGKEVFVEQIHRQSARSERPLLRLNCAALPENLLESELFGHERGAFSGAVTAKVGLFEAANGGTVFLDEIGEMPAAMQAKLLRVLEDRRVRRVGGMKDQQVDVRFVSATHRKLEDRMKQGEFRTDLYYRINGISIAIPPLRSRKVEILPLARHFAAAAAARLGKPVPTLSPATAAALEGNDWPGNVRELRNVVERAVALSVSGTIEVMHLGLAPIAVMDDLDAEPPTISSTLPELMAGPRAALSDELNELERDRIVQALQESAGNQSAAAKLLGISRKVLLARLDQHKIPRPRKGRD